LLCFCLPRLRTTCRSFLTLLESLLFIAYQREKLKYVGLVSVAFGLPPIATKAFRTLSRYRFDTNCLMFFASCGALALGDFPEAAAVVFLFAGSEWLEVRATRRARQALSAVVCLRPDKANLLHPSTKEILVVPATAVPVGSLVSVKTGDKIPCDGVVVEGTSSVDESSLTGESRPIRKMVGSEVSGGTINSGLSHLLIRTTSTSDDSAVSRLIKLVEEAQANRSTTEKLVDKFAQVYTVCVMAVQEFAINATTDLSLFVNFRLISAIGSHGCSVDVYDSLGIWPRYG
jgi:Zn2+/Cd2+-exporting ATPase